MTMQRPIPTMPRLDPLDPYQMYAWCTGWLYEYAPEAIDASNKEIGQDAADYTELALETGMKRLGMRRGNPAERRQAYVRKYEWPLQVDHETGMLLHPVMASQPVYDPATGLPTGEMQQVPTNQGEDLWLGQSKTFPRQFKIDALDAVKLDAPVPDWVYEYVMSQGVAGEAEAIDVPYKVQPLRVDDGPSVAPANQPQALVAS